ncbi:hypothetical protein GCM10007301_40030 [Azorhizobium oxalatiphilum]|uniref:Uncharacterized protein n=1 Tax=Azorhizobium oxalatiphilum TaxID=980631 RepID=A0A917C820_9HYPH|nr:hypothetical protein [Azorhizobium oxalatiphilum]GGF76023.1 hypothetical protein GCM10007301_40030 [Azorhizobium oxalatiphilum]
MLEISVLIAAMTGAVAGSALAAWLSGAPIWKGALTAALAMALQLGISTLLEIDNPIVNGLLFILTVGLIGGRWGFGLGTRQLALVVLGSVLFAIAVPLALIYLVLTPLGIGQG